MKPVLEDLFLGPSASPSFSQGYRWEDSRRRVRVVFAGVTIADSKHVMLLHEFGRLPVFYFPQEDMRIDLLEATEHRTHSPLKGQASYWTARVGDRSAEHAAWSYPQPLPAGPKIQGYLSIYWDLMDAWFLRRAAGLCACARSLQALDILPSSRHVRILLGSVTIAETHHPLLLLETGLPTRYYIPQQDILMECLEPTETTTRCPYKGMATYWSVSIGEMIYKDIVWSYQELLPEYTPIAHFLCLYNERVDAIYVDDELMPVPKTIWSE